MKAYKVYNARIKSSEIYTGIVIADDNETEISEKLCNERR